MDAAGEINFVNITNVTLCKWRASGKETFNTILCSHFVILKGRSFIFNAMFNFAFFALQWTSAVMLGIKKFATF